MEEGGQADGLVDLPEREEDVAGAFDEDHAVVCDLDALRIELEIRLVETTRPFLVGDRERDMRHYTATDSSTSSESSRSSISPWWPEVLIASSYIVTSFGHATTK